MTPRVHVRSVSLTVHPLFDEHSGNPPVVAPLEQPSWRAGRPAADGLCSNVWYEFMPGETPRQMTVAWTGSVEETSTLGRPLLGYAETIEEVFFASTTWYGPESSAGGVFIFSGHHGTRVLETSAEPDDDGPILVPTGTHAVDVFWFETGDACRQTLVFDQPVKAVAGIPHDEPMAVVVAGDAAHWLTP